MIESRDLNLILDTMILADIVQAGNGGLWDELIRWAALTTEGLNIRANSRVIRLLLSNRLLADYSAGLSKRHIKWGRIKGFKEQVQKANKEKFPVTSNLFLVPWVIGESHLSNSTLDSPRDPYDEGLGKIVGIACQSNKFRNQEVILASRDDDTVEDLEAQTVSVEASRIFNITTSLSDTVIRIRDP